MKKPIFALVCAALAGTVTPQTAFGQVNANPASDFVWEANKGGGVTITEYRGQKKAVVIPAGIDGKPVTAIGEGAFSGNELTRVVIPNSVTAIGYIAFSSNRLTRVTIPDSVITIGVDAFYGNRLTGVTIPNSVTAIDVEAFSGNRLTSVTVPASVPELPIKAMGQNRSIGAETAFSVMRYKNTITITGYNREEKDVVIPASIDGTPVTAIGRSAFSHNRLTSVTIPDSVTAIEKDAFIGNRLTSVTLPAKLNVDNFTLPGAPAYNSNGKKAGTYTRSGDTWTYAGR